MRIGIALRDASSLSGVSRIARESARVLAALGHEVFLLSHRLPRPDWGLDAARVFWRKIPLFPFTSMARAASFDLLARREAGRLGLDSLWGHGDLTTQDLLYVENCDAAYPERIGSGRRASSGTRFIRARQFLPGNTRRIVATSALVERDLQRFYGVSGPHVRVINHGVDCAAFHPGLKAARSSVRARLGIAPDAFVALALVSGDIEKRNIRFLAKSFHSARLPDTARLLCVGPEVAGLGPRCVAPGPTSEVGELYGAADLFVLPALYEEFGLTVLEAMATGVPVLLSALVGAAELVTEGVEGFVLKDPRDPEALAALLERACSGADLKAMGASARRRAETHPWELMVRESLDFLAGR